METGLFHKRHTRMNTWQIICIFCLHVVSFTWTVELWNIDQELDLEEHRIIYRWCPWLIELKMAYCVELRHITCQVFLETLKYGSAMVIGKNIKCSCHYRLLMMNVILTFDNVDPKHSNMLWKILTLCGCGSLQIKGSNLVDVSLHIKTRTYYGHNHWYCQL